MRFGFDLRPFLRFETGVGVYFRNLLSELARLDAENEYYLFSASWKDRFPPEKVPPFKRRHFRDLRWPVKAVNLGWYRLGRPSLDSVFGARLDLTHSPTPLPLPTRGLKIVTVCDLFFMDYPGKADAQARRHFLKRTEASLRRADGIVTISEFTKRALRDRFGLDEAKIKVTPLGLSRAFQSPAPPSPPTSAVLADVSAEVGVGNPVSATLRKYDLPGEFLLFVGATEARKNLPRLIEALAVVHRSFRPVPLVLVGREGGDHARVLAEIRARGLEAWVRLPGYLPESEVGALYRAASAFVFPSYCEGFGLPLLEAMACGLPAAASDVSALPEVGGDAALYFRPEDPEDIAAKIIRLLSDEDLRAALRARGRERARAFTWEKTAAETLAFYGTVLGRR
jgi:glycosyltransferase involved in cell wall biosynthesis